MDKIKLLDLVILALATWRMSHLLTYEDGPWHLFERLRYLSGVRYDAESHEIATTHLAEGVLCTWCNSVWFGMLWAALYAMTPGAIYAALPLALSALSIAIQELCEDE